MVSKHKHVGGLGPFLLVAGTNMTIQEEYGSSVAAHIDAAGIENPEVPSPVYLISGMFLK